MHTNQRFLIPLAIIIVLGVLGGWYVLQGNQPQGNGALEASGTIEAVEVIVAPEIGGKISEVLAAEGQAVQPGDVLFRLDDALLQAQRQRAQAGLEAAQAAQSVAQQGIEIAKAGRDLAQAQLDTANAALEVAQAQFQRTLNAARLADLPARTNAWKENKPTEFDLPVWYFQKPEDLTAAQSEVEAAASVLEAEQANFDTVIKDVGNAEFVAAESRLAQAQAAFSVANAVLERARGAHDNTELQKYAQELFDSARAELDAAQTDYDKLLSDEQAANVLEARARLMVAQERHDAALDQLSQLQTGDDALEVLSAQASVSQARANVAQAEAGVTQAEAKITQAELSNTQAEAVVAQAQAELAVLDLQIEKLAVTAPVAGVVTARSIEPGELIQAGAVALTIGQLDDLSITVYLPEDRYGEIRLGDRASVTVDSFPGKTFSATVEQIADQAEFTPRNVQTADGRRTTVFAVKLSVESSDGTLKPGMPADVAFGR